MQACAVIGCGPAGIAASTRLRQSGLLVTCFELAPSPGGIWLSNSRDLFSCRGLISPIHPSMRCVLPKDLMSFSDVRFDYTVPQFPHHSAVQHYLERVADQTGVRGLTRFNTKVESIRFDAKDGLWKLITVNVKNGDVMEWTFDKVCVATGQTQEVRYPRGLKELLADYVREGGELHHSSHVKDFRAFRHKRVVVLGDGVSAYDYCVELRRLGAEVFHNEHRPKADLATALLSWTHKLPGQRKSAHQANEILRKWLRYRCASTAGIRRVGAPVGCTEGRGIVFGVDPTKRLSTEDAVLEARERRMAAKVGPGAAAPGGVRGVHVDRVDAVISATGYTRRFPFLHKDLRRVLEDEDEQLLLVGGGAGSSDTGNGERKPNSGAEEPNRRGLYLGTLLAERPSLAFVGFQRELLPPFLMFEAQSQFVAYAFSQRTALPETPAALEAQESRLSQQNPLLRGLYSSSGLGLHSAVYFNVLEQQLGIGSRNTYTSKVMERRWWVSASSGLRLYHGFRSMAPLKRKKQHLLFSNKI